MISYKRGRIPLLSSHCYKHTLKINSNGEKCISFKKESSVLCFSLCSNKTEQGKNKLYERKKCSNFISPQPNRPILNGFASLFFSRLHLMCKIRWFRNILLAILHVSLLSMVTIEKSCQLFKYVLLVFFFSPPTSWSVFLLAERPCRGLLSTLIYICKCYTRLMFVLDNE